MPTLSSVKIVLLYFDQTGEPGRLPSMGSHRVGHDWSNLAAAAAYFDQPISEGPTPKDQLLSQTKLSVLSLKLYCNCLWVSLSSYIEFWGHILRVLLAFYPQGLVDYWKQCEFNNCWLTDRPTEWLNGGSPLPTKVSTNPKSKEATSLDLFP